MGGMHKLTILDPLTPPFPRNMYLGKGILNLNAPISTHIHYIVLLHTEIPTTQGHGDLLTQHPILRRRYRVRSNTWSHRYILA